MKTLARFLPLAAFAALLIAVRLSGCKLPPLPTTGSADSTSTTADATEPPETSRETTTGEIETKPPATEPSKTTAQTASETTATTASTTTETEDFSELSNDRQSWYYIVPSPTGEEKPATIPRDIRDLAEACDVIWQAPQDGQKVVYLTMDEGYEFETNTTEILNTAKIKGVPITFFITGSYLRDHPDLVGRMVEEGHLVANHTVSHPNLPDLLAKSGRDALLAELSGLADHFKTVTGIDMPKLVRPPEGAYSERMLAILNQAGYRTVFWSFAYRDWLTAEQPDPEAARAKILGQLHDGSVLLLHAVSDTNVAILPGLIDEIQARGYEFALIDEITAGNG